LNVIGYQAIKLESYKLKMLLSPPMSADITPMNTDEISLPGYEIDQHIRSNLVA
jgi:hypothetical protein